MSVSFPFKLIEPGSKVVLFGVGDTGKAFYLQNYGANYCQIVAWTATTLDAFNVVPPFIHLEELPSLEYDYIVIAIDNYEVAEEVRKDLLALGIPPQKIVRPVSHFQLPKSKELLMQNLSYYLDIYDASLSSDTLFRNYQSFEKLGFSSGRSTEARIALYRLRDILKKDSEVLDIGCNTGFLDLQIAPYAKSVLGIDYDESLIKIASKTKDYLAIDNVTFRQCNFLSEPPRGAYDVVLLCAVYYFFLSKMTPEALAAYILQLLKPTGYLVFESSDMKTGDAKRYNAVKKLFMSRGLQICWEGAYFSGSNRSFAVLKNCN